MSLMTPTRIAGTFEALRPLNSFDFDKMARLGIPAEALAAPTPMRASYVHFSAHSFEFDHHSQREEGEPAYLFLRSNSGDEANDIVAWSPSSGRLASWLGRAWALGEDTIYRPRLSEHGALAIWRDAADWLRARREGICLIRAKAAVHHLCDAGPLLAEGAEHASDLKQLLTVLPPRILIPAPVLEKAF